MSSAVDPRAIISQLEKAREAARDLRQLSAEKKSAVLLEAASLLEKRSPSVLSANAHDLASLKPEASPAFRDRLLLNESRIAQMAESLRQVAALPDPVGEIAETRTLANGLLLKRTRAPLGVILMIFESRPNVATEAFSIAFKSGNVVILKGGKESARTTEALYGILHEALGDHGVNKSCLWGVQDPDRTLSEFLLQQKRWIDVVVPRGGDALIEFVSRNSLIPIIKNDRGMCHVYVHEDADPEMAIRIVENAKTHRPGVCNAMETLLVHERVAPRFLPALHERLSAGGVQWFASAKALSLLPGKTGVQAASKESWDTEYLELKMNCRVVSSLEEAIRHIEEHGSRHSEAIVTSSEPVARRFQAEVDAAAVYWNASTRFTDGFEFGLGGELGISTQKLHVRGPVGIRELISLRWVADGTGQIRK